MNNWISVKDRMPTTSVDVLVTDGIRAGVACRDFSWGPPSTVEHSDGWLDMLDITHWQPLPELPKP